MDLVYKFLEYNDKFFELCLNNNNSQADILGNDSKFQEIINTILNTNDYNLFNLITNTIYKKYNLYNFQKIPILFDFNNNKLDSINKTLKKNHIYIHDSFVPDEMINDILLNCNNKNYIKPNQEIVFINDIYSVDIGRYNIYNQADILQIPFVQKLVTDPFILNVCQSYLGTIPILAQANFWITNGSEIGYQDNTHSFHQDYDDLKFIKVFIYLNDVNLENGPHEYVKKSINNIITPEGYKPSDRLSNNYIKENYSEEDILTITGKRGTIIFENTHGFHRGYPVNKNYRYMLQLQYISSLSFLRHTKSYVIPKNNNTELLYNFKKNYPIWGMLFHE